MSAQPPACPVSQLSVRKNARCGRAEAAPNLQQTVWCGLLVSEYPPGSSSLPLRRSLVARGAASGGAPNRSVGAVRSEDKRFYSCAVSLRLLEIAGPPGFEALTMQRSACGLRTKTSIQNCCRTPWNQETTSIVAHLSASSASGCGFSQIVQLRDMSFPCLRILQPGRSVCSVHTRQHGAPRPWHLRVCTTKGDTGASPVGGRTFNPRCPCAGRTWRAVPRTLT